MTSENISATAQHQSKKKRTDEQVPSSFQVQRRRVWRACENCRRKKIKCEGNEPVCTQCSTTKSQCTWLQTKDRAALSRHYVQELESRLINMETLFAQITPVLEQLGQTQNGGFTDNAQASQSQPSGISQSSASLIQSVLPKIKELNNAAPDQSVAEAQQSKMEDDMTEAFEQLALDEHGHLRWIGGSSTMSLIQAFRAITTSPMDRVSPMEDDPRSPGPNANKLYFPASVFFGRVRALPGPEDVEYPDRDLADKLVEAYFSRFHFLLPILDKPSFLRNYNYLMQHTRNPTPAGVETAFISLVFAVFACAARFVDDPRLSTGQDDDGGMGMIYYERSLILHYITHASIQVSHVQIFTLMSAFLCSVNCLPQAWLLTGQAVRSAQDLGLHRSPRRLSLPPIEKETRRKVWWGVYSLDRMLALALGRPLGIEDSDCDVELPVDAEDESLAEYFSGAHMTSKQPSLMAGFIALVSLYKIGGNVLRKVYALDSCGDVIDQDRKEDLHRSVEALDQELSKWCDDLPIVFKTAPATDQQVSLGAVLSSHYYSVLTTLHRNFLPGKRDQPASARSTARALSSARSCISLAPSMKNVVPSSLHSTFFLQNLFSSAVIILLYAMHVPDPRASSAAMDKATSCLDVIGSWEGFWPGARKCKELLLDLTNTARQAIENSLNRQANAGPASSPASSQEDSSVSARSSSMTRADRISTRRKPGRPRSRDVRQVAQEDARTRSTSRKRPLEDDIPEHSVRSSRLASPHSPYQRHSRKIGSQSSPIPSYLSSSPPLPDPTLDTSLNLMDSPTFGRPDGIQPSATQMSSSSPLGYSFSPMSPSTWTSEQQGFQESNPITQDTSFPPYVFGAYGSNTMDPLYGSLDEFSAGGMGPTMDFSAPSESFAASGLPFRGLDFIRNYANDGLAVSDQAYWQSFDAGAFIRDLDMPFTVPDMSSGDGNLLSNNS